MEEQTNCTDDAFSKFIQKAKKKLSKKECIEETPPTKKTIEADYRFEKSKRAEAKKKLEAKIKNLLKSDPNAINPIEKLIDHTEYDSLSESSKERYILQLSNDYNEIKNSLSNNQ